MAIKSTKLMKSLYTFKGVQSMTDTLDQRWWVDPGVAYLYKLGVDVQIIPLLLRSSKEYAVAKIGARINKGNMSENYHKL
jgi:hypothetical protein